MLQAARAGRASPEPQERWVPVPGYEGFYEVSDAGAFRSLYFDPPRHLAHGRDSHGYPTIMLSKDGKRRPFTVHRIVAVAFHADKRNALHNEVAHLDGDRTNPSASNLKWVSKSENHFHMRVHGTHPQGEKHASAVLTDDQAVVIKASRGKVSARELAERFGVGLRTIHDVQYGRRYAHVRPTIAIARRAPCAF